MATRAHLCVSFKLGSLVRLTALFTREPTTEEIDDGTAADADDWQPMDPDHVTAWTKDPNGLIDDHAYLDSPADIERDDVGRYHLDVIPDVPGTWYYGWRSSGHGQAADEYQFLVEPSQGPPL